MQLALAFDTPVYIRTRSAPAHCVLYYAQISIDNFCARLDGGNTAASMPGQLPAHFGKAVSMSNRGIYERGRHTPGKHCSMPW